MTTYDEVLNESEKLRIKLLLEISRAKRVIKICQKKKKKNGKN